MATTQKFVQQESQPIAIWYPTVDILLQKVNTGELVVYLLAAKLYLGIYEVQLDCGRSTPARVAFTGLCRLEQTRYACYVEISPDSRQGRVWLRATETYQV